MTFRGLSRLTPGAPLRPITGVQMFEPQTVLFSHDVLGGIKLRRKSLDRSNELQQLLHTCSAQKAQCVKSVHSSIFVTFNVSRRIARQYFGDPVAFTACAALYHNSASGRPPDPLRLSTAARSRAIKWWSSEGNGNCVSKIAAKKTHEAKRSSFSPRTSLFSQMFKCWQRNCGRDCKGTMQKDCRVG